jgi:hypothetical protein
MTQRRALDRGNPIPEHIGVDFDRLGMNFWREVRAVDPRNGRRCDGLARLNEWRNAIAHQDWSRVGGPRLQLSTVRRWRSICRALARDFDTVARAYLSQLTGERPW